MTHFLRKLGSSVRICGTLLLARSFGRYRHSVWGGDFEYAVYVWRSEEWAFPVSSIKGDK